MDQTTTDSTPPGTALLAGTTPGFLALIALTAFIALIAIWWGQRLRRRRIAAERDAALHRAAAAGDGQTIAPPPIAPPPTAPPSVAPPVTAVAAAVPAFPSREQVVAGDGDLGRLKGVGPKIVVALAALGYTSTAQLAALTPDEADALDAKLDGFSGRMARDRWIEQARLLSSGDTSGYEAIFGRLG